MATLSTGEHSPRSSSDAVRSATLSDDDRLSATAAAVIAGLLIGFAECLFFALALARLSIQGLVWQLFGWPATSFIQPVSVGLAIVTPVAAGIMFGWLLRQQWRGRGHSERSRQGASSLPWWRFVLVGPYLLLASTLGVLVGLGFEPLAEGQGDAGVQWVFRTAFSLASGLAALACTGAAAITLQLESPARRAAMVAVVTAATYLVVSIALAISPAWHVGAGDMAMPRIAMLGNLIAGGIGGATAFRVLAR